MICIATFATKKIVLQLFACPLPPSHLIFLEGALTSSGGGSEASYSGPVISKMWALSAGDAASQGQHGNG